MVALNYVRAPATDRPPNLTSSKVAVTPSTPWQRVRSHGPRGHLSASLLQGVGRMTVARVRTILSSEIKLFYPSGKSFLISRNVVKPRNQKYFASLFW
jgi:hypothetical protein